jgi:hypothetical protein
VAADLLTADDKDDDGIPLLKPVSCGRDGQAPIIIKLPTLRDEALPSPTTWAKPTRRALPGATWPCCAQTGQDRDLCASALAQRKLPRENRSSATLTPPATRSRS